MNEMKKAELGAGYSRPTTMAVGRRLGVATRKYGAITTFPNGKASRTKCSRCKAQCEHAKFCSIAHCNGSVQEGKFAYRKWELPAGHPTLRDIHQHMESKTTRDQVARILQLKGGKKLHDKAIEIFVTQYTNGDFLSMHDDAIGNDRLPTFAFVISLTAGAPWVNGFGGQLEFLVSDGKNSQPSWGKGFVPKFNRAMFFRTSDPHGPFHRVTRVSERAAQAGWLRFGFTGWCVARPT